MDKNDVDRLFRLLEQFYPNARQIRSRDTRLAWELALRRYPYEQVRAAAVAYAQRNKYFPDLADLTAPCVPREDSGREGPDPVLRGHVEELAQLFPTLEQLLELMERDYTAHGVPHPSQARKLGWTPEYWVRVCRARAGETVEEQEDIRT